MSRMFLAPDGAPMKTWSPFTGCLFECIYCWARSMALTRLKNKPKYRNGFAPTWHPQDLWRLFRPGWFVFVSPMGDISFAHRGQVITLLERIRQSPKTWFLFQTKNPMIYWHWEISHWPENLYLGATIETTEDYGVSKAPAPVHRYEAMRSAAVDRQKRFISIEPVMDFHLATMVGWMEEIWPDIIEVGADNYNHHLQEPPAEKLHQLLRKLKEICPKVIEKKGLERLLQGR